MNDLNEVSRFKITPEPEFDLAEILAESREYLEQNGWGTGEFQVKDYTDDDDWDVTGYCAMGAVLYSQDIYESECGTDPRTLAVAHALLKALDLTLRQTSCAHTGACTCVVNEITHWNDEIAQDAQEVLDAFMKAEKIARSGDVA